MDIVVCFQYKVSVKTNIEICSNSTLGIVKLLHEMLKFQFDTPPLRSISYSECRKNYSINLRCERPARKGRESGFISPVNELQRNMG